MHGDGPGMARGMNFACTKIPLTDIANRACAYRLEDGACRASA